MRQLLGFRTSAGSADVVEGDRACAEEDEAERKGSQSEGELVSAVACQSVVQVHLGDSDGQIDADSKARRAGEQAQQHEQTAEELGEGGEISHPARQTEAGDQLNMVVKSAENLVISMGDDHGTEDQAHD